jgi:Mg2+ and Co2+ transporter CorA
MPELQLRYGYAGVWGLMIVCVLAMLVYFGRKKWL